MPARNEAKYFQTPKQRPPKRWESLAGRFGHGEREACEQPGIPIPTSLDHHQEKQIELQELIRFLWVAQPTRRTVSATADRRHSPDLGPRPPLRPHLGWVSGQSKAGDADEGRGGERDGAGAAAPQLPGEQRPSQAAVPGCVHPRPPPRILEKLSLMSSQGFAAESLMKCYP